MWNRVATGEEVKVNFGSSWEFTGLGLLSHISHAYYLWNSSCEVELWEICSIKFKILKESTSPFPFFFKKNFFFLFFPSGCTRPQSQHVGSLTFVAVCETLSCDMWDLVPWSGIEPGPPAWGTQSLSYWPPGKSPLLLIQHLSYSLQLPGLLGLNTLWRGDHYLISHSSQIQVSLLDGRCSFFR